MRRPSGLSHRNQRLQALHTRQVDCEVASLRAARKTWGSNSWKALFQPLSCVICRVLILNKSDGPFVILDGLTIAWRGIELVDAAKKPGLRVTRVGKTIRGLGNFIRTHRFDDIGGDNDHEL